jgi:hypothetical protein
MSQNLSSAIALAGRYWRELVPHCWPRAFGLAFSHVALRRRDACHPRFVDVKLFYSPNSAGSPIGTGKLYGLLLIQFIDLEIASQIATRDCFLK